MQFAQYGGFAVNAWKHRVTCATTAAIANLSSVAVNNIDGITLQAGDRVLVKNNASPDGVIAQASKYNGIYVVGAVAGGNAPLTRAEDCAQGAQLADLVVKVQQGTVNAGRMYAATGVVGDITPDTTALTFYEPAAAAAITEAQLRAAAAALTASLAVNSQKITGMLDPTAAQDAATKNYVDGAVAGARDWKDDVRVATAAALAAYTRVGNVITANANGALANVDGVALSVGDRLLLKDGAAGADNGIYTVTQLGDGGTPFILTRATDADASAEVTTGMAMSVSEGSTYADSQFLLTTNGSITLNTTALTFSELPGVNQRTVRAALAASAAAVDFNGQNLTNVGTTDGRDVSADGAKLDLVRAAPISLAGAGAASLVARTMLLTANGVAQAVTVAAGSLYQRITFVGVAGYDGTNSSRITPAAGTASTIAAIGESVEYEWNGAAWAIVGRGVAVANMLAGTAAPTANEDSGDGYGVGSVWVDQTNDKAYICTDATAAAAVWVCIGDNAISATEYSYLNGVTSAIQTQLDAKQASDADLTAHAQIVETEGIYRKSGAGTAEVIKTNLGAAVAPTVNEDSGDGYSIGSLWLDTTNKKLYIANSVGVGTAEWICLGDFAVSDTEYGYLNGVTSALQTQLDAKQASDTNLTALAGIAAAEGIYRKSGAGTAVVMKTNLGAAADPGVNDDTAAGYSVGSLWVDTTNDKPWVCVDATNGAAVWKQTGGSQMLLTNPVVNAAAGSIIFPTSAAPAQTIEGSAVWDSDDDVLTIGDGADRKTLVGTTAAQAITGKTKYGRAAATELTIAAGVITATQDAHRVDTEADAASDDLDTINGGAAEDVLYLRCENTARTVVLKHAIGNIYCPGGQDISLADIEDYAILTFANSKWSVVAHSCLTSEAAPLRNVSVTIPSVAGVRTLNATPYEIVPAPGATKFIQVESVHAWLDYGTATYDAVAGGDDLAFKYTNASGAKVTGDIAGVGFGDQASDQHRIAVGVAVTPVANAAIVAHILQGEWYAAAGDSPLKIEMFYHVRTLDF